jgi:hypothetical protein
MKADGTRMILQGRILMWSRWTNRWFEPTHSCMFFKRRCMSLEFLSAQELLSVTNRSKKMSWALCD